MIKGRRAERAGAEYWRSVVAAQAQSGLGVRAYCRKHRLAEPAFYYWRRRLCEQPAPSRKTGRRSVPRRLRVRLEEDVAKPPVVSGKASSPPVPRRLRGRREDRKTETSGLVRTSSPWSRKVRFAEVALSETDGSELGADAAEIRQFGGEVEIVLPGGIRLRLSPEVPVARAAALAKALSC